MKRLTIFFALFIVCALSFNTAFAQDVRQKPVVKKQTTTTTTATSTKKSATTTKKSATTTKKSATSTKKTTISTKQNTTTITNQNTTTSTKQPTASSTKKTTSTVNTKKVEPPVQSSKTADVVERMPSYPSKKKVDINFSGVVIGEKGSVNVNFETFTIYNCKNKKVEVSATLKDLNSNKIFSIAKYSKEAEEEDLRLGYVDDPFGGFFGMSFLNGEFRKDIETLYADHEYLLTISICESNNDKTTYSGIQFFNIKFNKLNNGIWRGTPGRVPVSH